MTLSPLTSESSSRVERKRARNRDALLAAARRLFSRHGFDATTIADIADAADLGFGTFYNYFADKEAILDAVLDAGRAEIDGVLLAVESDEAPASESLARLSASFARAVRRNHDALSLMWRVGVRGEAPGAKRVRLDRLPPERSLPVMLAGAIRRIIERGVAAGEFVDVDAVLLSRFLASAHMYLLSPTALDFDEAAQIETLCEFELRGLAPAGTDVPPRKARRRGE